MLARLLILFPTAIILRPCSPKRILDRLFFFLYDPINSNEGSLFIRTSKLYFLKKSCWWFSLLLDALSIE